MVVFGFNLVDLIIISVFIFYAYEGYILGFYHAFLDLTSFIFSFVFALKFYDPLSSILTERLSVPSGFSNAIAFFLIAFFSEIILNIFLKIFFRPIRRMPAQSAKFADIQRWNRVLGLLPGAASAFLILSFLLSVVISLPASPLLKQHVVSSKIGSKLIANAAMVEKNINDVFGGALNETLNFMTVRPESDETVSLQFRVERPVVDAEAEVVMLRMVNDERRKKGLPAVAMNQQLQVVARAYAKDMFQRGYFSHYNPEGASPFDRMEKAGITFTHAGENLALAPSVELAMQGLMNSPGHRANILSENFGNVGIGVMDGGIYGKMFVQEFKN